MADWTKLTNEQLIAAHQNAVKKHQYKDEVEIRREFTRRGGSVKGTQQGIFKTLVGEFAKLGKGIISIAGKIYEAASLVVLAPFKGAMKKGLKAKGVKYEDNIKDISTKFMDNVVSGNSAYEQTLMYYQNYEALDDLRTLREFGSLEMLESQGDADNFAPAVPAIISAVVAFFNTMKQKKDEGVPMSQTEKDMTALAEEGMKNADELIKREQAAKVGEFVMDKKIIIAVVVGILLLVFLFAGKGWRKA